MIKIDEKKVFEQIKQLGRRGFIFYLLFHKVFSKKKWTEFTLAELAKELETNPSSLHLAIEKLEKEKYLLVQRCNSKKQKTKYKLA